MKEAAAVVIGLIIAVYVSINYSAGAGYNGGKKAGVESAQSEMKKKYGPEVASLTSELQGIKTKHAHKVKSMNDNHAAQVRELNAGHTAQVNEMKVAHNTTLQQTKDENFSKGQSAMTGRISETIDLNTTNKKTGTGWNDTVSTIRE